MPDVDRLEHFIAILKTVRDRGYNVHTRGWVFSATSASFGGWAGRDITFQKQGLIALLPERANNMRGALYLDVKPILHDFDALRVFFDLDDHQTNWLFADNPWLLGFPEALTCDEEIHRARQVQRGEV